MERREWIRKSIGGLALGVICPGRLFGDNAQDGIGPGEPRRAMQKTPSNDQEWQRFTGDLAVCLADLMEDEYLIISCKRSIRYVQFAGLGKFGMRAEAAGNAYIEPDEAKLSTDDYVAMSQLGWQMPKGIVPDPQGSPNFYLDLQYPVAFELAAELATRTFRQIYRLRHPGQLQYKSLDRAGTQIRFPGLCLKRDE